MLECSATQRAPRVPRLTQTSSSDMVPEWYISWITSRKHAWMPLHHTPRTRDDALLSCTLLSEASPGGPTGLHQHQRYRHTVALKHRGLTRMCQSECSSWPSPALLFRQAAPNSIYWPVPLAAEHRSWTALRKPAKSKINLAGHKFSLCKQSYTLILISCYSTLIIQDLPLCRAD